MVLPAASQVRALLDAVPPRWRAYVAVCAFAGLRLGEASALRVADVDFLRRTITVARQVQGYGTAAEVRAPKYGSERTVYAAPGLTEILAAHVAGHCPGKDPGRWLLATVGRCRPGRSARCGAGRPARPDARGCTCITCGTSMPAASSRPGATW